MKKLGSLFLLFIVLVVSGCSTTPVDEAEIVPGEYQNAATIIFHAEDTSIQAMDINVMNEGDEEDIVSCIENSIKKQNPDQSFISYYQFVRTILFPDYLEKQYSREPETYSRFLADEKSYKDVLSDFLETRYSREPDTYTRLLSDEESYKNVLSYGVRYLIFVRGSTSTTNEFDWLVCNQPFVCLGYKKEDYKTQLAASILDLHQKETVTDDLENISEDTA